MKNDEQVVTSHGEIKALVHSLTPSHVLVFLVARSFLNRNTTHEAIGVIVGFTHHHTCSLMRDLSKRGLIGYERVGRKGIWIYKVMKH